MTSRASGWRCALPLLLAALAGPAAGAALKLPGNATMTREVIKDGGGYALPVGPWSDGALATRDVQGRVTRQAWRIDSSSATTLQLMDQLEAQLEAAGYSRVFRCAATACGGFDFRFAIPVLAPPEMFVDLFDYRFLSAQKVPDSAATTDADAYVTLLISRSGANSYVQITRIAPDAAAGAPIAAPATPVVGRGTAVAQALAQRGHVVLRDLDFATGADTLGSGPFASLRALATFLKADSNRRMALVGHTDTVGGKDANLALSRRRANAVMQRLIDAHGVSAAQLEADGIAYMAPLGTNSTAAGREANRRVEAVLLSAD